jgi:hypothetical protein
MARLRAPAPKSAEQLDQTTLNDVSFNKLKNLALTNLFAELIDLKKRIAVGTKPTALR